METTTDQQALLPLVPACGEPTEFSLAMADKSCRLQRLLQQAGYEPSAGIRLVKEVAQQADLRDWPNVRDEHDYDNLIQAVKRRLEGATA